MSNLNKIFDFLNAKSTNTIEVWDILNDKRIHGKDFRPNTSSLEVFKNEIKSLLREFDKIGVQRIKKNGNANVRDGAMMLFERSKNHNTDVDLQGAGQNPAPGSHQNHYNMNGMNGAQQGLSYADIGKITNYDDIKNNRDTLKNEVEKLRDENRKLELDNQVLKMKTENGSIGKTISEHPEVLTTGIQALVEALGKIKGNGQAGQLNAPAGQKPQITKTQAEFIEKLYKSKLSDPYIARLSFVLDNYITKQNEQLIQDIENHITNATANNQHQGQQ